MAIIQYTGLVNQIRGKLNGSVFNKARNVNTLQRKQQAPRRQVGISSTPRNRFGGIQRSWKTLANAQRTQWGAAAVNNPSRDRFGDLVSLSGYNQFIKANIFASYAGLPLVETPDTSPAPDPLISHNDWSQADFSITLAGQVAIEYDNIFVSSWAGDDMYILMDIGLPVSPGVTTYYGRWLNVASQELQGNTAVDGSKFLTLRYPMPQPSQVVWLRSRVFYALNGAIVYEDISSYGPIE